MLFRSVSQSRYTTGQSVTLTPEDIGTWKIVGEAITITPNKVPEGEIWYIRSIQTINRITLENYPLENLDTTDPNIKPYSSFGKRKPVNNKLHTTDPQYGLCLKTYNSDIFQNWINTECPKIALKELVE